ncbi:SDR family NAD(P)-dependent oxidoreductase [Aliivibrio wodanis]|uniref:SDR family NAD(P)-dependent oxidoreductase n=1 Tax=Aliivibrio wodanis TaxID=80852 RepID=UPI00406D0ACE
MNVIIIGGTSGIGLALAKHYVNSDHQVVICGRDITKVPAELKTPSLSMMNVDVSQQNDLIQFFDSLKDNPMDIVIYCAGKYFNERRLDLNQDEQNEMRAVNATGFNLCFELASQKMISQGYGHLVTIASIAGLVHSSSPTLYSRLKADMITQAKHYAATLENHNINVTAIAPGYINTQKLRELNGGDASHKPFLLEEHQAVNCIIKAIKKKKILSVFPLRMKLLVSFLNYLPLHLVSEVLRARR